MKHKVSRRSARTGKSICRCGRGYASEFDGLCFNCRGRTAYDAKNDSLFNNWLKKDKR